MSPAANPDLGAPERRRPHKRGRHAVQDVAAASGSIRAWSVGSGEPVLLIHGAFGPDGFDSMIEHPALSGCRCIGYRRRGHIDSAANVAGESIESYAQDALAVLDHFGVERAHVLGHSYSGRIALELARQAPARVHSLLLLECDAPPGLVVPSAIVDRFRSAAAAYQRGEPETALEILLTTIGGETSRHDLSAVMGAGWFEQAVADIGVLFEYELPAPWQLTMPDIAAMAMPSTVLIASNTIDYFREVSTALAATLPNCDTTVVPDANHWLNMAQPTAVAPHVGAFIAQHPMTSRSAE